eukprot:gnl/TRDRNA2_/TRDRNA2_165764_c0_seq1.p1 gnl/TRDRNA2_/TRDRNA2_165764_c0~~gnl/TRDRNA2_/TRDRNA2_165764_c0_seq1.p1  ORF type:complete len:300 (+),score=65.72 gnl/TRDRNA2_/TRDRNA2_165764_c0_seq1:127-900(+)
MGKIIGACTILNGIIVLAMPVGVIGANFSYEYYLVQQDKQRRLKEKQELDTQTKVEHEQDAAVTREVTAPSCEADSDPVGAELQRIDAVRHRLLVDAEVLNKQWEQVLRPADYSYCGNCLRTFITHLILNQHSTNGVPSNASSVPSVMPVINTTIFDELDDLTRSFNLALQSVTDVSNVAEFGLKDALKCRRMWVSFSDRCWEYIVDVCQVEKPPEPLMFRDLKSQLGVDAVDQEEETGANEAFALATEMACAHERS